MRSHKNMLNQAKTCEISMRSQWDLNTRPVRSAWRVVAAGQDFFFWVTIHRKKKKKKKKNRIMTFFFFLTFAFLLFHVTPHYSLHVSSPHGLTLRSQWDLNEISMNLTHFGWIFEISMMWADRAQFCEISFEKCARRTMRSHLRCRGPMHTRVNFL